MLSFLAYSRKTPVSTVPILRFALLCFTPCAVRRRQRLNCNINNTDVKVCFLISNKQSRIHMLLEDHRIGVWGKNSNCPSKERKISHPRRETPSQPTIEKTISIMDFRFIKRLLRELLIDRYNPFVLFWVNFVRCMVHVCIGKFGVINVKFSVLNPVLKKQFSKKRQCKIIGFRLKKF